MPPPPHFTAELTPPAVKFTAEDILASVTQAASRLGQPDSDPAKAAPQTGLSEAAVDAERPKLVEPETAQVSNFELKKATAEMDLSQFAQTARQLVEQANVIESATRDPARPPVVAPPSVPIPQSAAKQRIADLLKGLEFGKDQEDEADMAPAAKIGEDVVDVDGAQIPPGERISTLASELKPNREGVSRNWLGTGSHSVEAVQSAATAPPIDVQPVSTGQPTTPEVVPSGHQRHVH